MTLNSSHQISAALLGAGGLVYALVGKPLPGDENLKTPLNPMGVCRSPYGEVFAMAMQSPIDVYWHGRLGESDHDHDHGEEGHVHGPDCDHDHEETTTASSIPLNRRLQGFLTELGEGVEERTNHTAYSKAFDYYLRRQIEDKLRFANQLDPAHYANYNTYHFFLTQSSIGTRPQLTPEAAKLAQETIRYCLADKNDPRPSLTAAGAASNILEMQFNEQRETHSLEQVPQIKQNLVLLDGCLANYDRLAKKWDETGNWKLLSPMRIQEVEDRHSFILKMRGAFAATLQRLETESPRTNPLAPLPSGSSHVPPSSSDQS